MANMADGLSDARWNSTEATKTENGASSDNLREAEQIRECLYKEQGKF